MTPVFLTVLACVFPGTEGFACRAVTLSQPYATVDLCDAGKKAAIAEWEAGATIPHVVRPLSCGPASPGGPDEERAPAHLSDMALPGGGQKL